MGHIFAHSLYHAIEECLKVLPVLFIAYLLVSLLSHDHGRKFSKFLSKNKRTSVLYASFLGCVPQCGFSSFIADLYSRKTVSLGTLIAVFVATSDEAIPLMISDSSKIVDMLILIGLKIAFALFWGYLIDLTLQLFKRKKKVVARGYNYKYSNKHCGKGVMPYKTPECGHIHSDNCGPSCGHQHGDCCADNIFLDAFKHTFSIVLYIFVASLVLNCIVECVDTTTVQNLLTTNVYIQIILASLIGLIPNCASSVLLVQLFIGVEAQGQVIQILQFPALVAGLTAGAGVGLFILLSRNRKYPLKNLGILLLQYAIGVTTGMFLTPFF